MPSPSPLVSILIPCHNYGRFLAQAIESLLAQSWKHWECIIVDDGSTDNTRHVAARYQNVDPRIHCISQPNQGVSAARNTAISASSGDFIQFLDADDSIESDKLMSHASYLIAHPGVDLVYGDSTYFHEDDGLLTTAVSQRIRFPQVSGEGGRLLATLIRRNIMVVNAPLIRRSAIDQSGYFDTRLRGHEDWEYWIRLAINGKMFHFHASRNARALVRVHSRSTLQNPIPMLMSNLKVRHQLCSLPLNPGLHRLNQRGIGLQFAKLAKIELHAKRPKEALHHAMAALKASHGNPLVILFLIVPQKISTLLAIAVDRLFHKPSSMH